MHSNKSAASRIVARCGCAALRALQSIDHHAMFTLCAPSTLMRRSSPSLGDSAIVGLSSSLVKDGMERFWIEAQTECERVRDKCCAVCGQTTDLVCEGCLIVRYCDRDCQRHAWAASHRRLCAPTKLVCAQIKENKLLEEMPSADRSHKRVFVKIISQMIGDSFVMKEPSFKANGRLRGKQPRCTEPACENPNAIGVRYVMTFSSDSGRKRCACASCWTAVLKEKCDDMRRTFAHVGLTDGTARGVVDICSPW